MTKEKLFELLTEISDKYIREAEGIAFSAVKVSALPAGNQTATNGKRSPWYWSKWSKWGAIAACLAVTMSATLLFFPYKETPTPSPDELPSLTISSVYPSNVGGGGVIGGYAFIKSEWINANPWTEDANLSTLPVFRNTYELNENRTVKNVDYETMENILVNVATSLGLDASQFEIHQSDEGVSIWPEGMSISVDSRFTTFITFTPAVPLPDEYNISDTASYTDMEETAKYLKKTYKKLIHTSLKRPKLNITDKYYNSYNTISFFEGGKDLTEQIVNYNFNTITFNSFGDDLLELITINQPDLSQKLGDYPIISIDEAKALLETGNYFGAVKYKVTEDDFIPINSFPGLEYVKMVELVYLPTLAYSVHIPYYCFYAGSLYYVPAIDPQYITNMPVYGEFPQID